MLRLKLNYKIYIFKLKLGCISKFQNHFIFSASPHLFAMKYDYVIFGASGFTGQFVVEFLANALKVVR